MSTQVHPLAYTTDTAGEQPRVLKPIVIWCWLVGVMAAVVMWFEVYGVFTAGWSSSQLAHALALFKPVRLTTWLNNFESEAFALSFYVRVIAGLLMLATAGLARSQTGGLISGPVLLRIRLGAICLLAVPAILLLQQVVGLVRASGPLGVPMTQVAFWTLNMTGLLLIPGALLWAASCRWFHVDLSRARQVVMILLLTWGVIGCLLYADQAIRWPFGTQPHWIGFMTRYLPTDIDPAYRTLLRVHAITEPVWECIVAIGALVAGLAMRRQSPRSRTWLRVFAIVWLLATLTEMAFSAAEMAFREMLRASAWPQGLTARDVQYLVNHLFYVSLHTGLAIVAWWLATAREPET